MKTICCCTLFLFIFIGLASAQTQTKRSVKREYYSSGCLHLLIRTRVTTNRFPQPQHNYKRSVVDIWEYYENGNIKSRQRRIRKVGDSGRPYYELLTDEKFFDENGTIQSSQTSRCDHTKIIHKEYDTSGNLVYKSIAKPWRKNGQ